MKIKFWKIIDWLTHMLGYTIVLIIASIIFKKTIYIDSSFYWLLGLLAVVIIFILNRTVKPILFWLTLPITGITLGLFYPLINVLILKITDFILLSHFEIKGIFFVIIVSIFISILNWIMDNLVINKFTQGVSKWIQ